MKKLIGITVFSLSLVGCATPQQNAALAGAVIGASVAATVYAPQPAPRPVVCNYVRGAYVGRDAYGNPMFEYRKVCR